MIKNFESELNEDQEVGIKIVSLGNVGIYYVQEIDYWSPYILVFHCLDQHRNKATLTQHFTQLNFLLNVLTKLDSQKPAKRIGFRTCQDNDDVPSEVLSS